MDYEKKYDEALKRAKAAIDMAADKDLVGGVARTIFSELRESEDERIRKTLIEELSACNTVGELKFRLPAPTREECIAWLEKQKEQKPAEVKDPFSNANFVRGYESGYADAKREQKPIQTSEEKEYIRTLKSLISDFIRDKQPEDVTFYQKIYDWLDGRHIEQKPAGWNEEDEKMSISILNLLCSQVAYVTSNGTITGKLFPTYVNERDWFKKRLKSLRPSWKPSEEQMNGLAHAINLDVYDAKRYKLDSLYNDLKKLM